MDHKTLHSNLWTCHSLSMALQQPGGNCWGGFFNFFLSCCFVHILPELLFNETGDYGCSVLIEERSSRRVFCHETVLALVSLDASWMLFGQRASKHHIGERNGSSLKMRSSFSFLRSWCQLQQPPANVCLSLFHLFYVQKWICWRSPTSPCIQLVNEVMLHKVAEQRCSSVLQLNWQTELQKMFFILLQVGSDLNR